MPKLGVTLRAPSSGWGRRGLGWRGQWLLGTIGTVRPVHVACTGLPAPREYLPIIYDTGS